MRIDLKHTKDTVSSLLNISAPSYIKNLAAQMLLFALAKQPRPARSSNLFVTELAGDGTSLCILASRLGEDPHVFANRLDSIINARNLTIHFAEFPTC
jgi:hypothetical protein